MAASSASPCSFALDSVIGSVYSKGTIRTALWNGQQVIFVPNSGELNLIQDFKVLQKIADVVSFGVADDLLVTVGEGNMVTMHVPTGVKNAFRVTPDCPISCIEHREGTVFAFGFTDGSVRVLDVGSGTTEAKCKLGPSDVVTHFAFPPGKQYLIVAVKEGKVFLLHLKSSKIADAVEAHSSSLTFLHLVGGRKLLTGGRDRILSSWLLSGDGRIAKSQSVALDEVPMGVSASSLLDSAGHLYRLDASLALHDRHSLLGPVTQCFFDKENNACAVINDMYFVKANPVVESVMLLAVGACISVHILNDRPSIIFAHSSTEIVILEDARSLRCRLLLGRGNSTILATAVSPKFVAGGSKEGDVFLWDRQEGHIIMPTVCLTGHTGPISALALAPDEALLVSTSADQTIKCWAVASKKTLWTRKAHDKDINGVEFDGGLLITASQDKTAKVFDPATGDERAVLVGHSRSVWSVKRYGDLIATSSADRTVKLWDAHNFSCIRTLEGHTASVLHLQFLNEGRHIASVSSNGLLKILDAASAKCHLTLDEHADRIWSCAVSPQENFMATASDDCTIKLWINNTIAEAEKRRAQLEANLLAEQELSNCLLKNDFRKAIRLSISLQKPRAAFDIISKKLTSNLNLNHSVQILSDVLSELQDPAAISTLMSFVREWNAKFSQLIPAQALLRALFQHMKKTDMEDVVLLQSLIAHTEQHYTKIDDFLVQSALCDLLIQDW